LVFKKKKAFREWVEERTWRAFTKLHARVSKKLIDINIPRN